MANRCGGRLQQAVQQCSRHPAQQAFSAAAASSVSAAAASVLAVVGLPCQLCCRFLHLLRLERGELTSC